MAHDRMPSAAEIALAEEIVARHGLVTMTVETQALIDRILDNPEGATEEDFRTALYAINSGPRSDFFPPLTKEDLLAWG